MCKNIYLLFNIIIKTDYLKKKIMNLDFSKRFII